MSFSASSVVWKRIIARKTLKEGGNPSFWAWMRTVSSSSIGWWGKRTSNTIEKYMMDLKLRVKTSFQLSTDGYELFEDEVRWAFFGEAHYGQVTKQFIHPKGSKTAEGRYQPSRVRTIYKRAVFGCSWMHKISTSYIDRTHLSMRLFNRRLARLTLGYSRKLEYLKWSVALSIAHFNFCRVHSSLKGQTPAMAAELTDHVWCIADLLTETGQLGDAKRAFPQREGTDSDQLGLFKAI